MVLLALPEVLEMVVEPPSLHQALPEVVILVGHLLPSEALLVALLAGHPLVVVAVMLLYVPALRVVFPIIVIVIHPYRSQQDPLVLVFQLPALR